MAETLGQKMQEAANKSRLTAKQIAEQGPFTLSAIYKWWSNSQTPRLDLLQRYAQIVDCPNLLLGDEGSLKLREEVLDLLLAIAKRMMVGDNLRVAVEATLPGVVMSEEERIALAEAAAAIRTHLREAAGGEWDLLSDEAKRRLVAAMISRPTNE